MAHWLDGHEGGIHAARFAWNDARVLTASADGTAGVWATEDGALLRMLRPGRGSLEALAAIPATATCLVGYEDGGLGLWDFERGVELDVLEARSRESLELDVSRDGRWCVSGDQGGSVVLWDLHSREARELVRFEEKAQYARFGPAGRLYVSDGEQAFLLDPESGKRLSSFTARESESLDDLAFDPRGRWLASLSADRGVRLWDDSLKHVISVQRGHRQPVVALDASPDGTRLATACFDGTVKLWDTTTPGDVRVLEGHPGYVYAVAVDPVRPRFTSAGPGLLVRTWDLRSGAPWASDYASETVLDLAYSSDGKRLAVVARGSNVRVLDPDSGALLHSLRESAQVVAFRPGTNEIALGLAQGSVAIWSPEGDERRTLATEVAIEALAYSTDGTLLAGGGADGIVRLWSLPDRRLRAELSGHEGAVLDVAFHPRSNVLVSASEDWTLRAWDPTSGACLATLRGHGRAVEAVAFHPDGSRLFSGGRDRMMLVWETSTWRELLRLPGHEWWIYDLAVSPGGEWVVTASKDRTLRQWGVRSPVREEAAAEHALERRVAGLVDRLFEEHVFRDEVSDAIRGAPDLSPSERETALRLARVRGDSPVRLQPLTWESLCLGEAAEDLDVAIERARAAAVAGAGRVPALNRDRGAGCVRSGDHRAAIDALGRVRASSPEDPAVRAGALAFEILARLAVSEGELATSLLEELEALARAGDWPRSEAECALLAEVRQACAGSD